MDVFLTGSHAYGTPRPASDVDLAVYVDPALLVMLRSIADPAPVAVDGSPVQKPSLGTARGPDDPGDSLRFGRMNLLCFTSKTVFESWRSSTIELRARRPVTRDAAVALIKANVKASVGEVRAAIRELA